MCHSSTHQNIQESQGRQLERPLVLPEEPGQDGQRLCQDGPQVDLELGAGDADQSLDGRQAGDLVSQSEKDSQD